MKAIVRQIIAFLYYMAAGDVHAAVVYQNQFDSGSASLLDFGTYGYGTGSIQVANGQLALATFGVLDANGISLDTGSLPGYSTNIGANPGTLTWAFNVSNSNGPYNNKFTIVIAGSGSNPYSTSPRGYGYSLGGGGYVGNRMIFSRFDNGMNTRQILIDVPNASGLDTLPRIGAVRVTFEPDTDTWSLYMDTGLTPSDPATASHLLGTAIDGTYAHTPLPYFTLGGGTTGTDYFDNLSISVVPEPSSCCLTIAGLTTCFWMAGRSRKA